MNESDRINNVYNDYLSRKNLSNKWSRLNEGNKFIEFERFNKIKSLLELHSFRLEEKEILDVGCAGGHSISFLKKLGGLEQNMYGIDIRKNRVCDAKKTYPTVKFYHMDARDLKFDDNKFDLVNIFTVFTSIVDFNHRIKVSKELTRVLKPGGIILYYDFRYHNPFNNNVVGLGKKDIDKFFPRMEKKIHSITLFPPLARRLGKYTKNFYLFLSKFKILRTHYVGFIIKGR